VRLSRKLKLTPEATADKIIAENQKWRNLEKLHTFHQFQIIP
jgi:hypothetical protein